MVQVADSISSSSRLVQLTGRGGVCQVVGGIWNTVVRLGGSMIVARILSPGDFGVIAMAMLVYGVFTQVTALGATTGVMAKKDLSQEDLSTAFWMGCVVNTLLFVALYGLSPSLAKAVRMPQLASVTRCLSTLFLLTAIGGVFQTIMTRQMRFTELTTISAVSVVLEVSLAVFLVVGYDMDYWALVWSMVVGQGVAVPVCIVRSKWWPSLSFSRRSFKYLMRYGLSSMVISCAGTIRGQFDALLVGPLFGAASLGVYSFSQKLPNIVYSRFANPLAGMTLPALAYTTTPPESMRGYLKVVRHISLLCFPVLALICVFADPIVRLLWGDRWLGAVPPMRILSLATMFKCVASPIGAVFNANNKPGLMTGLEISYMIYTLATVGLCTYVGGVVGAAVGILLSKLTVLVSIQAAKRITDCPNASILAAILPALGCSASLAVGGYATMVIVGFAGMPNVATMVLAILTGTVMSGVTLVVFYNTQFKEILSTLTLTCGRQIR